MGIEDLSERDQLLHARGAVAEAHTSVEEQLRAVFQALAGPGKTAEPPEVFHQLQEACARMLHGAPVEDRVKELGAQIFREADDLNRRRNRVLHDQWVFIADNIGDDVRLVRSQRVPKTISALQSHDESIDDVRRAAHDLTRVKYRLSGLHWSLTSSGPLAWVDAPDDRTMDFLFTGLLEGRFELDDNGGAKVLGR